MDRRLSRQARERARHALTRRRLLALGAASAGGFAGCAGDGDGRETDRAGGTTATTTSTPRRFRPEDRCGEDRSETNGEATAAAASDRFLCLGRPVGDFETAETFATLDGWTSWGGETTLTGETAAVGRRSVRARADSSDERCGVVRRFEGGVDLSGYDVSVAARLAAPENEGVYVQLRAPDGANMIQSTRYCWHGGWVRLDHGPTKVAGNPDLTDVRELRIGMYLGEGATGEVYLDSVRAAPRRDRGAVVFTFDDNHVTQYEKAFPLLEEFGYTGTVGTIPWKTEGKERLGPAELRELRDAGWTVACHPQVRDTPLSKMGDDDLRATMVEAKRWLRGHGFERGARVLVWPFGQYDGRALALAARHHDLAFSTATSPVGRVTDPYVVPRVNGGDVENAKRMVDLAERFNQVCVLMYHQISDRDRAIQVSASGLRETLEHVAAADVDVWSIAEFRESIHAG
jgi:peptidoglycan/xylan/chitin deacetylase (PgdA/CDA1 family)